MSGSHFLEGCGGKNYHGGLLVLEVGHGQDPLVICDF